MEIIEDLLKGELRDAVIGLVDDVPDDQRLDAAGSFHSLSNIAYNEVLSAMLTSSSDAIRAMTVYHIGELRLRQFETELEAVTLAEADLGDLELARERLARVSETESRHAD